MKAKEWIGKYESYQDKASFSKEYGEETAKLVLERTKTSKPDTKLSAMDGAIREQRSKFRAIAMKLGLNEKIFEDLLDVAVPEYKQLLAQKQKPVNKTTNNDVQEYRKKRR